mgnify:CR=1 FL=1
MIVAITLRRQPLRGPGQLQGVCPSWRASLALKTSVPHSSVLLVLAMWMERGDMHPMMRVLHELQCEKAGQWAGG